MSRRAVALRLSKIGHIGCAHVVVHHAPLEFVPNELYAGYAFLNIPKALASVADVGLVVIDQPENP